MSEQSQHTTSNGHEIKHARDQLEFIELQTMLTEYGLYGHNSRERLDALRETSKENLALFITDMNRRLQGSDETLVHENTMKIGERQTIDPSDRYDIFTSAVDKIQKTAGEINPERIGDTLALVTVMLHPFKDGNGRTARLIGFIFRDDFDAPDATETFTALVEPRDLARERGGFIINGYIPYVGEGVDQSKPDEVGGYLDKLLSKDGRLYTGPYGQAELVKPVTQQEDMSDESYDLPRAI